MTVLDEIAQEKQQLSERLMRLDAEWTKLDEQMSELEIAERVLNRFGTKVSTAGRQTKRRPTKVAVPAGETGGARGHQTDSSLSLADASLTAVRAHRKGASANEVLDYLTRKLGMTVRPNHLGMALQRHRRAGRLEDRDHRWYFLASTQSKRTDSTAESDDTAGRTAPAQE